MSTIVTTCFTLFLFLGNLCPMQLLAYAAEASKPDSLTTSAEGHLACTRTRTSPIAYDVPQSNRCTSGHCVTADPADAVLTVMRGIEQHVPFSLPLASKISAPLHSALPSALAANFPIGPPLSHIATIVLRI
ncbi:hypothetical protein A3H22_01805 [Candidatus Peribacteria bacterium RIFCSPLOWO2_12_FULL_55_15]|nr:MAG: hypothetical protein A2789_03285 [Candidatus Peribacteria bacterium RIFCSPHIGHO2_01_FULL_54_22]OGJ63404.1 MAG: hypothetical protein A3D12_04115 [Candidatus Peribacteria bacterium RIFCSPHIGHO2_02_FULL_55_24]OGJ64441.1 MAG: hypothetical protein A3E47_00880 [Candidatus Peribacteria bacterium RIFCSPHIGHO2_12_FULL_54_10]OGJ67882.1 MAG: hypothetical protein A2947_03520 [Candidatus Peribacteria bacterium RIFCSPLOWO2_01_FULL_54_110]OGJ70457.1 MAG: hypothetical protein A3H90_04200 [Candidatus Pe